MKTDRHGQAKILTSDEIHRLFETGFTCDRDRALFGICLYTACRINEACTLLTTDVYDASGVKARLTIRKGNTKGQQDTRQVAIHPALADYLTLYQGQGKEDLFPGRHGRGHLHPTSADAIRPLAKVAECEAKTIRNPFKKWTFARGLFCGMPVSEWGWKELVPTA